MLTKQSEVFDGVTLKAFCETCGEDDCRDFCCDHAEEPNCKECPVQKSFEKLHEYEVIGSPAEYRELMKAKDNNLIKINRYSMNAEEIIYYQNNPMFNRMAQYLFEGVTEHQLLSLIMQGLNASKEAAELTLKQNK